MRFTKCKIHHSTIMKELPYNIIQRVGGGSHSKNIITHEYKLFNCRIYVCFLFSKINLEAKRGGEFIIKKAYCKNLTFV